MIASMYRIGWGAGYSKRYATLSIILVATLFITIGSVRYIYIKNILLDMVITHIKGVYEGYRNIVLEVLYTTPCTLLDKI